MNINKNNDILEKFFSHRDLLIAKFGEGTISKSEYIKSNIEFMEDMDLKPFKKIDSFEKGIYNYQYYNMYAKYYYMEAEEMKKSGDDMKYIRSFLDEGYYYYKLKDKVTMKLLKYLKFKNVEAYYIDVDSESLSGRLYEIYLRDYDKAILHSKNFKILDELKKQGVFKDKLKKSLIDEYVNVKY